MTVIYMHDDGDRRSRRGFTLIEAMLGMMVLLTAAAVVAPAFVRDLILGRIMWERRLAVKTIESELDWACTLVSPPNPNVAADPDFDENGNGVHQFDFDELMGSAPLLASPFPPELDGATGSRVVTCLDGNRTPTIPGMNLDGSCPDSAADPDTNPENLKRVVVTVTWTSRGRQMSETSADYLISRIGVCSDGS